MARAILKLDNRHAGTGPHNLTSLEEDTRMCLTFGKVRLALRLTNARRLRFTLWLNRFEGIGIVLG